MSIWVIVTLVASIAILILTLSATTTLLRDLKHALASMEFIAASQDFSYRLQTDSSGEIGRISRSFNGLLDIAERLLKEKDYLAATDPLTGINNRLRFAKVLHEEADRKRRTKIPMSLIIFDIDHFKRINDTYGHNVGDEVLKTLTRLISGWIRDIDLFARWGGEEFVLLLKDNDCDEAMVVAEKLRSQIASVSFPAVGKVTCSFGVTAWKQDDTEASFVARADKALYASKNGGRNQVICEQGANGDCRDKALCMADS
jgi:diguanylate cyclase (GGDEF)-like protein